MNINKSGHYNVVHTHGDGRLACIFYLTDGHRKLGILNTLCTDQAHLQCLDELGYDKNEYRIALAYPCFLN